MIVSVRQWTFLRPARRILRALAPKAPAESRVERQPKRSFMEQFEDMMTYQANMVFRNMDNQ